MQGAFGTRIELAPPDDRLLLAGCSASYWLSHVLCECLLWLHEALQEGERLLVMASDWQDGFRLRSDKLM